MDLKKSGAFISQARKARGLTQKELAKQIGVTDKAVSRWETGTGFPDVSCLETLADALGVSILELLRGELCGSDTISASTADISMREALRVLNAGIRKKLQWTRMACKIMGVVIAVLLVLSYTFGFISMHSDETQLLRRNGLTGEILYTYDITSEATMYMIYEEDTNSLHLATINSPHLFNMDVLAQYKQIAYDSTFSISEWEITEYFAQNEHCNDTLYRVDFSVFKISNGVTYSEHLILGAAKDRDALKGLDLIFEQEIDGAILYCAYMAQRPGLDMFY